MERLISVVLAELDPTDSVSKGCIRDFGGVSTPDKIVRGIRCEAGLGRLVAVNGVGEYSLKHNRSRECFNLSPL